MYRLLSLLLLLTFIACDAPDTAPIDNDDERIDPDNTQVDVNTRAPSGDVEYQYYGGKRLDTLTVKYGLNPTSSRMEHHTDEDPSYIRVYTYNVGDEGQSLYFSAPDRTGKFTSESGLVKASLHTENNNTDVELGDITLEITELDTDSGRFLGNFYGRSQTTGEITTAKINLTDLEVINY